MNTDQSKQTIDIPMVIPLEALAGMILEKAGTFLPSKGMAVSKIHLSGNENKLLAELETSGAFSLIIKLSMIPDFDTENDAVLVREFEMETQGGSLISQAAGWLMNTFFTGKVDDKIASVLTEQYRKMKSNMMQSMDSVSLSDGFTLKGNMEELRISDLTTTPESIRCMLHISGAFTIYAPEASDPDQSQKEKE